MSTYRTDIINQIDDALIAQWKSLWKRSENATVFNSYEYFLTWQELTKITEYELFVCYKKNELVAILPLKKSYSYGINCFTTILNSYLVDTPFLMETYDKELFKHFFALFLNKNIFFQKIDEDAVTLLRKTFPKFFFSIISINPTVALGDDPFKNISQSTIKQVKKTIRKSDGKIEFIINSDNLEKHFKTMMAIQNQSSKKLRGEDIFSKKETRDFFNAIIRNCPDLVRICLLYVNRIPIAYQYGYLYKKSFACDQIAYRNDYAKLRPGKTVLYYLIEMMKDTSVKWLDLGGGISSYKTEFTDNYRVLYNLYYSPNPAIMAWWKGINFVRRVKQVAFPKKHTRDHQFLFKPL